MKELFKKQLEGNSVITEETLNKLQFTKKYKNGDDIKIGDKVLLALLTDASEEKIKAKGVWSDAPMERNQDLEPFSLELIMLNESQFDLYTYDERFQDRTNVNSLPIIRLKQ